MFRFLAQVPFPSHVRVVTGFLQESGQRHNAIIQVTLIARLTNLIGRQQLIHVAESGNMVVIAGHEH